MRDRVLAALLYGAAALFATPAAADLSAAEVAALKEARAGDMTKLVIHKAPRPRLETQFQTERDAAKFMSDYEGKIVVVNFWATWCPPCRKEMPSIDRLKGAIAGDDFEVLAVALDRASPDAIKEFYRSIGVEHLRILREPTLRLGTEAGILGMPITIILDREGREIARLQGEAEWDSEEVKDILARIMAALDNEES